MLKTLKISFVLLPMSILLVVGVYIYSLWASDRQHKADLPVEAADVMMRDLLSFHKKRGCFPKDLKEMEGIVWERKEKRLYSEDKRGLTHRNYYYLYTRVDHHHFTLWAIPVGRVRDDAATIFLESTSKTFTKWRGAALSIDQIENINLRPSERRLTTLGLAKQ